jgi:hypothetical protein
MPPIIPFIPLISAAIGAATTGVSIAETLGADSTPKPSTTPTPLTSTQNAGQTAAVGQQLPNLQTLTGGSLSPEYFAQFGQQQAGLGNNPQATGNVQSAINNLFGFSAPGQTGLTPSTSTGSTPATQGGGSGLPGILDMLNKPPNGGSSPFGGSGGAPSWMQAVLNGNSFQGLAG